MLSAHKESIDINSLASMDQDVFDAYLSAKKTAFETALAEENARIEAEIKAERECEAEDARIREENAKLKADAEKAEKERLAKEEEEAQKLIEDAKLLEDTGCFALVLEKVPASLAKKVAQSISIPVIGIGAGAGVDGQVLVTHDLLGMTHEFSPRFLRRYLSLFDEITGAIKAYVDDVKSVDFPNEKEQY